MNGWVHPFGVISAYLCLFPGLSDRTKVGNFRSAVGTPFSHQGWRPAVWWSAAKLACLEVGNKYIRTPYNTMYSVCMYAITWGATW